MMVFRVPLQVPFVGPLLPAPPGASWQQFQPNLQSFNQLNRPDSGFHTLLEPQNGPWAATLNQ